MLDDPSTHRVFSFASPFFYNLVIRSSRVVNVEEGVCFSLASSDTSVLSTTRGVDAFAPS
jgi:hypothetical protein